MTARTRYVFLGAGGVLTAGLVGGLAAWLQGGLPMAAAQSRPEEFRYIPADTHMLAFADVRAMMTSDLRERMREPPADSGTPDFEARTGIRVGRDIDEALVSLGPDASGGGGLLVMLSGRFDAERLEALAVEFGGELSEHAGHTIVATSVDAGRLAMSFVEPGVLAMGSETLVRRAIDLADEGDNVTANERLMALLSTVEPGSSAWAVGELDRPDGAGGWRPGGLDMRALRVSGFSAAGRVNGGVRLTVRAETPDDAATQNLRDILQGFIALARMQADAQPEFAGILDSIQLRATPGERFVSLSMALPAATVEWLWEQVLAGAPDGAVVAPAPPPPPAAPEAPRPPDRF